MLVQDYHFALLPRMIRERLPDATIITFWHIPWPNPEAFAICPWRDELLDGLLGSSILGFHTQFHCNNFLDTVDRLLEARVDRETFTISFRGQPTARAPLSDLDRVAARGARRGEAGARGAARACASGSACRATHRLGVGIDRLDYTKGIIERFNAVARLLEKEPRWVGRFTLRADRGAIARHRSTSTENYAERVRALADEINARFARRRAIRRSCSSSSTTSPRPSTSITAPPTCASSAACTTA